MYNFTRLKKVATILIKKQKKGKKKMKQYTITQKVKLNGQIKNISFPMYGSDDDVKKIVALMEGAITVKTTEESLGRATGADTNITSANFVTRISVAFANKGDRSVKYISPYNGGSLVFKNTSSTDDIETALSTAQMLKNNTTEKPITVSVNTIGKPGGATPASS
jgi:predicted aldo/keto reductase-like oxidoreductase